MTRNSLTALVLAASLPLVAQQPAAPAPAPAGGDAVVATINGETITRARLDQLWERAGTRARTQYEKNGGGKMGFLENYIKKRLVLQEAHKKNFQDQAYVKVELEAARESALFDLYVRDVLAAPVVTESMIKDFYEQNKADFELPARARVRHILISTQNRPKSDARGLLMQVMQELAQYSIPASKGEPGAKAMLVSRFGEAAKKYSEDTTAANGGDIGWMTRDKLEEQFADVVFSMPVGVMSGIVETPFGLHLILVEARENATTESYESARSSIREFLMTRDAAKVLETVSRLSNELRRTSKVAIYPENIQ